jgi:hypothetical protein
MWEHRCMATKVNAERCTKDSRFAFHCFKFEDEHFASATWVEVCETHQDRPESIVSGWLDIAPVRK